MVGNAFSKTISFLLAIFISLNAHEKNRTEGGTMVRGHGMDPVVLFLLMLLLFTKLYQQYSFQQSFQPWCRKLLCFKNQGILQQEACFENRFFYIGPWLTRSNDTILSGWASNWALRPDTSFPTKHPWEKKRCIKFNFLEWMKVRRLGGDFQSTFFLQMPVFPGAPS